MADFQPRSLLLLPPRYTEDSIILWQCASQLGWDTQRVYTWRVEEAWKTDYARIAIYGEPVFADVMAQQLDMLLLEPPFEWLTTLPAIFVQREIVYTTYTHARDISGPHFIKPADGKTFEAKVYASGAELPAYEEWQNLPVLVSEPVVWTAEFRCFICEGRLLTGSPYWRNEQMAQIADGSWPYVGTELAELEAFMHRFLPVVTDSLPPSVVVDVGIIAGKGWGVLEANPSWGSGLYGCDPDRVLEVIARGCVKRSDAQPEDNQWVPARA